MQLQLTLFRN
nr:unnamed protein product [Callosobruchus analis]